MDHFVNAPHINLIRHERNMRRRYPLDSVRRMGMSQVARVRRGAEPCVQPLIVTLGPGQKFNPRQQDPLKTKFVIVAGHRRHAGNAWLGKDAPLLNCIVRDYPDESSMLAEMSTENGNREDPSYLEWALHFQEMLTSDPTLNIPALARLSGKSRHVVDQCLDLLKLCPAAQELVDAGDLQFSAVRYLLRIKDPKAQAKIARGLARPGIRLDTIKAIVQTHLDQAAEAAKPKRQAPKRPAVDRLPSAQPIVIESVREGAALQCARCAIAGRLKIKEPAWHLALQAAGQTCDDCGLQKVKGACAACPLAEMMSRLARQSASQG